MAKEEKMSDLAYPSEWVCIKAIATHTHTHTCHDNKSGITSDARDSKANDKLPGAVSYSA